MHLDGVHVLERALQHRRCDLKADELMIRIRCVAAAGHLDDVEGEFGNYMRGRRLGVGDAIAVFGAEFWEEQRHGPVHRLRMPGVVGRVMRERAKRKRVFVDVLRIAQHRVDEIARAHVVQQVAEEVAAERIVPEVLDHRAAVRIRARMQEVLTGRARVALQKKRSYRCVP